MGFKMLIINSGSTSTKIGVYEDDKQIFEETIRHLMEMILYSQKEVVVHQLEIL